MKQKSLAVLVAILAGIACIALPVMAQTRLQKQQLEKRHSKVNAFAVRPNVFLLVRYSSDGQVCEMALEPRHWTGEEAILDSTLPDRDEIVRLVEEIVPESERGKQNNNPFNGIPLTAGGISWTAYEYKKMTLRLTGNFGENHGRFKVAVMTWNGRVCTR